MRVNCTPEHVRSLREQGYACKDDGFNRCCSCDCKTMPGVEKCYECWKTVQDWNLPPHC